MWVGHVYLILSVIYDIERYCQFCEDTYCQLCEDTYCQFCEDT